MWPTFSVNHIHLYFIPWITMIATILVAVILPEQSEEYGAFILLASGIILGMPHGACDVWAFRQAVKKRISTSHMIWFVAVYIGLTLLTLLLWRIHSGVALLGFLAITVWHFGSADAWLHTVSSQAQLLFSVGRGLIVMSASLTFQRQATQAILNNFVELSSTHDAAATWTLAPHALMVGITLQFFACAFQWRNSLPISSVSNQMYLWFETVLLLILFAVTPPLLAIACYFMGVHAWRHMLRLEMHSCKETHLNQPKNLWQILWRHHRHSFGLTIVTYLGLFPILWQWPDLLRDAGQWSVAYLVLVSAVTVPHVVLILWLEISGKLRPRYEYSH